MTIQRELADIQGNILSAYGRLGFPKGRFLLLNVANAAAGRMVIDMLRPIVTTAVRWPSKSNPYPPGTIYQARPEVAVNLAFTFRGLLALDVPIRTLRGMPDEFIDGMAARADILCDNYPHNIKETWDPVWRPTTDPLRRVHILVTLNAQMKPDGTPVDRLDEITREIAALCDQTKGGVTVLSGHRGDNAAYQDLSALLQQAGDGTYYPIPVEHFGFVDAIGDPVFEGQVPDENMAREVIGQGKLMADQTWQPIAAGEFLLGHPDESQEIAGHAMPMDFSRNGTFFAYRKLHQNVAGFRNYLASKADAFAAVMQVPRAEAEPTLMAKIAGRWADGVPLVSAPTFGEWQAVRTRRAAAEAAGDKATLAALDRALVDFTFAGDPDGAKCPFGSHLRRSNTRDMLDPHLSTHDPKQVNGSVLNNRRRILRRGLPYGAAQPGGDDTGEHGIVMLAACASLFRQFEFVQQQWMQYGLDFMAGNDTCPIIGNHGEDAKFVIASDPASGKPPFICDRLPQFVETRGGDYFFVPSMTALRMIATGVVDPT
ncbi:Dyp-type peroxidase [Humitalea sp. 24SJ18S-53]|uniref:Dyp-type peroxidase n=1 Tax=Humitalea sp. 24SJ18S-53 TaxID=3422307 RepID=UPI003D669E40